MRIAEELLFFVLIWLSSLPLEEMRAVVAGGGGRADGSVLKVGAFLAVLPAREVVCGHEHGVDLIARVCHLV